MKIIKFTFDKHNFIKNNELNYYSYNTHDNCFLRIGWDCTASDWGTNPVIFFKKNTEITFLKEAPLQGYFKDNKVVYNEIPDKLFNVSEVVCKFCKNIILTKEQIQTIRNLYLLSGKQAVIHWMENEFQASDFIFGYIE